MAQPIGPDYGQQFLLPPALGDWVAKDHPVRFIREFVEQQDLAKLGFAMPVAVLAGQPAGATRIVQAISAAGGQCRVGGIGLAGSRWDQNPGGSLLSEGLEQRTDGEALGRSGCRTGRSRKAARKRRTKPGRRSLPSAARAGTKRGAARCVLRRSLLCRFVLHRLLPQTFSPATNGRTLFTLCERRFAQKDLACVKASHQRIGRDGDD